MEEIGELFVRNYDDWKLHNPCDDEVVVSRCLHCDGEVYEGEEAYYIGTEFGEWVHEDCFFEFAKESLEARLETAEKEVR